MFRIRTWCYSLDMALWQKAATNTLGTLFRGAYLHRQVRAKPQAQVPRLIRERKNKGTKRNILFITTDQQRFDALGVNGGKVARTPVLDGLAQRGFNYKRAHVQSVVCMPSRSTILTGQYPTTHGVIANGIPLPDDAPSVAEYLRVQAGYRTALIGKAHFDPHLDLTLSYFENRAAAEGKTGPWHGFEHLEFASHSPLVGHHYAAWLWKNHPEAVSGFAGVLTAAKGGDTGAPEVAQNPIPREQYHTDWVAERTVAWLAEQEENTPWFCWMSFPDPHHPFDPPAEEVRKRLRWQDVPLPDHYPGKDAAKILAGKPRHWLDWYEGRFRNPEGGPVLFSPAQLEEDQVREVNAMIHVENELIDEACGRVLQWLDENGMGTNTDVVFTSDHGELQGDFGLMFKGPYHVDSLLQVPLIWRPANATAGVEVSEPVGHVDIAPTLCQIAGLDIPAWMQGQALPTSTEEQRERVITSYDSQFRAVGMHLRTIYRDGYLCTRYLPRSTDLGGRLSLYWAIWGRGTQVPNYDGSEGELYDLSEDPKQWVNLWNDPSRRNLRNSLLADLDENLPTPRKVPLKVAAPT